MAARVYKHILSPVLFNKLSVLMHMRVHKYMSTSDGKIEFHSMIQCLDIHNMHEYVQSESARDSQTLTLNGYFA